jgi:hypothetical protein
MQVHMRTTRIEVEDIVIPEGADLRYIYSRTIRLVGSNGEVVKIFCTAGTKRGLTVHKVKELQPLKMGDGWWRLSDTKGL